MNKAISYPIPYIRTLLENYSCLEDGMWFEDEDGEKRLTRSFRAPFENAIIAKADIDNAIESLGHTGQKLIKAMYLCSCHKDMWFEDDGGEMHCDLQKMFPGGDIPRMERRAVRDMANYLNGECVLARWCKENGFVDGSRHILIPEDIPIELEQYIKKICLDYCVIRDCPE